MSFSDFLTWILGSGGGVISASWILERIKWFQGLTSDKKEWVFFAFAAIINLLAYLAATYVPKEAIEAITPFFAIISSTFIVVIVGKMFHSVDKVDK